MTSPIETNNVVELLERAKALREECRKGVEDRGVMSDYCDACVALKALAPKLLDAAQSLSDRIDVLTRLVVAMDDHVDDCCGCFGTADPEMLAAMNECRASLTQGGNTGG